MADTLLEQVHELIVRAHQLWDEVCKQTPAYLSWLVDRAQHKMDDVWEQVQHTWDALIWPGEIWHVADEWSKSVAGPIAKKVGLVAKTQMTVDDHWSGPAASAYADALPSQQAALKSVERYANTLSKAYNDYASAMRELLIGFVAALVAFVIALVGALASIDTVAGPIVAAIGGAVALSVDLTKVCGDLKDKMQGSANELQRTVLSDSDDFPNGKWPTVALG